MDKRMMTAAFAGILMATAPLAYGQTNTARPSPDSGPAANHGSVQTNHVLPSQIRATEMDGSTVYDAQNQKTADIKDVIIDRDGRVAEVVLNVGGALGVGGRYVAVPMNELKITNDNGKPRFTLMTMTKDQLKSAQAFELNEPSKTSGTSSAPNSSSRER